MLGTVDTDTSRPLTSGGPLTRPISTSPRKARHTDRMNRPDRQPRYRDIEESASTLWQQATSRGVMYGVMSRRGGSGSPKEIVVEGRPAIDFVNCSYFGLDRHPAVVAAAQKTLEEWGVHFCCARSRLSIEPNRALESGLSKLFGGPAITFPSVSAAHASVMPLMVQGLLWDASSIELIFDRSAHASMQFLKPILAEHAAVSSVPHNDLNALEDAVRLANRRGSTAVYVADGVYSMGGLCPLPELIDMANRYDLRLYIDDAHGTSIYGERGEGYAVEAFGGRIPPFAIVTYSLAKGFGCNGGGVILPDAVAEQRVRRLGQTYAFSAPLDFSVIGAACASLELHLDGTVRDLQKTLRDHVRLFDRSRGVDDPLFSPIRMHRLSTPDAAIAKADDLLSSSYFVSAAFYPVIKRGEGQLRVAISTEHRAEDLEGLASHLRAP